ncbi:APC family permease [Kribbella solani]|uniref:APC family permease n=1 Tax=Kribbella solani TaxID=236067 RepID=UPI0029ADD74E|nr:APC family permease [Kribbella solani]MDX3000551.1 APC family permease [Kribbella solani]
MTPALGDIGKRLLLGRKLRSTQLGETLLPKRIALPVFASDALSSVAYAPDEVFLTLSIAGLAAYSYSWKIGLLVAFVMLVVVASYRQNVHAYPSGGGDYEVATVNIGPTAGLTVASALMVDYVLTVAVSISSGVQNAKSALPFLEGHEVPLAVGLVLLLTAMNLRGVRESGGIFAVPTYIFMFSIIGMAIWGLIRLAAGNLPLAESANFEVRAEPGHELFTGLAAVFLLARAFSSGCAALTGVEAISNGVPAFRKPKSRNAATTLLLLGTIAVTMLMSILFLAGKMKLRYAENPATQLYLNGQPVGTGYTQKTVIGQIGDAVFSNFQPAFYVVIGATMLILVLAANTAFNGFPVLASILARDGFLPRQLHTRGDRLAYSNGIVLLALCAAALIIAFDAQVTKLIQLYIVGVFVSFTLSQFGMIRHWTRHLKTETDGAKRRHMYRSRVINTVGLTMTSVVLVIVLLTKFTHGAYIAIIAMAALFLLMKGIRRHYETVRKQMSAEGDEPLMLPSRVHSIVLVSKLHRPTLRALAFAKAARPSTLEAVTVDVDRDEADALQADWDARNIPIPLKRLASPYREITRPILQYVRDIRRQSPRDVVMVYIPEYVVGHWWEHLLHNQSALRLKGRLLFTPGVMVTSVPYQLLSSQGAEERQDRVERVAGQVRRGARKSTGDR